VTSSLVRGCLAAAFATLSLAGGVAATGGPIGGTIAFATQIDPSTDAAEIDVVTGTGSGRKRVTRNGPTGNDPWWTSDGRHIVFTSHRLFTDEWINWRIDSAGGSPRRLPGDYLDSPSPSGRYVAVLNYSGVDVVSGVGKHLRLLRLPLRGGDLYATNALWSPDERYIAVNIERGGLNRTFVVRADGNARVQALVPTPRGLSEVTWLWSADSKRVFVHDYDGRQTTLASVSRDGRDRERVSGALASAQTVAVSPNGRVAFIGRLGGLYLTTLSGSPVTKLAATNAAGIRLDDIRPAWSPASNAVAFADRRGLVVVGVSSHRLRLLAPHATSRVSWAPAKRIVFSAHDEIYTIAPTGHALRRMTRLVIDSAPRLSPDGLRVAFVRRTRSEFGPTDVYVASADGTMQRRIGAGVDPRWAPDGRMIAYSGLDRRIRVVDLLDGNVRAVAVGDSPVWSARTKLAFLRHDWRMEYDDEGDLVTVLVSSELWVSNPDGTDARLVYDTAVHSNTDPAVWSAVWSPDGATIAAKTTGSILMFNPANGDLVDSFPAVGRNVSWSPDGGAVAYTDAVAIHVIDVNSRKVQTVATRKDAQAAPAWSPDGSRLAFTLCHGPFVAPACDVFSVARDGSGLKRLTTDRRIVDGPLDWR
jgi:Tol biopolymer transport system component